MKFVQLIAIFVILALFVNFCAGAKKVQKEGTFSISTILKEAKCPLTKEQEKQLKEFKPGADRGAFRAVYELFDEKQTEALKEVLGSSPGRDGGPERPRFLFLVVLFENEKCPFTGEQLKELKALPSGRGAFEQMRDMLTEKQNGILENMFNR